jgi:hypothetical protein
MIVIEKNAGEKIPYTVNGTKICFDDMLTMKCEKYQKDWPVHKDICMDTDGDLTMGTGDGLYYVAEVDIPAKEYQEQEPASDDEEPAAPVALPLDMDKVTLTLWALEKPVAANKEMED